MPLCYSHPHGHLSITGAAFTIPVPTAEENHPFLSSGQVRTGDSATPHLMLIAVLKLGH